MPGFSGVDLTSSTEIGLIPHEIEYTLRVPCQSVECIFAADLLVGELALSVVCVVWCDVGTSVNVQYAKWRLFDSI